VDLSSCLAAHIKTKTHKSS